MKRTFTLALLGLVVTAMTCGRVWAQGTAQISGAVQDSTGAVLPGAEITVTQTDTGVSRMTISNETGYYTLPNLPVGPYKLEASLPGFRTFVQQGIVLQVGGNPTLNVVLQVGQVSEQVEVQANAALVETRNVSVGQVMESARIVELPLNGRNVQELMLLGGGAVQTAPTGGMSFPSNRIAISSAGSLGTATEFQLDGIRHVDPYDGVAYPLPFPDALAEFKTELGGSGGSQGRSSQVSAVTKSGTNDLHGDLFEFVRNDLFNATQYFAAVDPITHNKVHSTLKRNQFGGTIGGPILKNKLFFFGGYQQTVLRSDAANTQQFVPTPAMLAGDFTALASPQCQSGRTIALKAPFVNNKVDPALFSPVALRIAAKLPSSNDPCGLITFGKRNNDDQKQIVTKVDYQSSAKHSIFGRFLKSTDHQPSSFQFTPNNVLNADNDSDAQSYGFTSGSTYLVTPSTVNAFRVSFSRNHLLTVSPQYFDLTELGSKVYSGYTPHISKVTITSGFSLPGNGRRNFGIDFYQLADDVSVTRGTHQFGVGARVAYSKTTVQVQTSAPPAFTFQGTVTGLGLADFMLGKASDLSQAVETAIFTRTNYFDLYAQDTWQIRPRLTMNYGLRWAPILPQHDVHRPVPNVINFDVAKYAQGIRSTVFLNAPPGVLYAGDPGFVQANNGANAAKPRADIWNAYWKDFAPKLGLAWDPRGDGKTSVRASYGLAYNDYPTVDRLGSQASNPPFGSLTRIIQPAGGLDDPWRGVAGGNPFPQVLGKDMSFVPFGEYMVSNPYLTPTYDQSWNLSVQREVMPGTLVSASYIGTRIVHLQYAYPYNNAVYIPGIGNANGNCTYNGGLAPFKVAPGAPCSTIANTQDRRKLSLLNPAYATELGRISTVASGGTQGYNGMLLSISRRPSHGVNMNANYTWSHCVGDYESRSNNGYGASVDQTYLDPTNRSKDRGNCEIDQRHNFNLTGVVETPKFSSHMLNMLGTGWRLSGLYRLSSFGNINAASQSQGSRTVTIGAASGSKSGGAASTDACLCDISNQRPNLLLPNGVYKDRSGRPLTQWLNPSAFGAPDTGTLGNLGRGTIQLPMTWQFDTAISRIFRLKETQSLEFRAEAFNLLNSFRPGMNSNGVVVDTNFNSSTFGQIRNSLDPRIMQFALKYLF